jgi:hypothetical protein
LGIADWGISQCTLDDVFLEVVNTDAESSEVEMVNELPEDRWL